MLKFGAVVQIQASKWLATKDQKQDKKKSVDETVRIGGRPDLVVVI